MNFKKNGKNYINVSKEDLDSFVKNGAITDDEALSIVKSDELKQAQKAFNNAIQTHLDNKAKEFRYDNMMSARSYAGYENPFQAEAQNLAVWASNCWVKAGDIEDDVQLGNRDMPTVDEVLNELPLFE